MPESQRRVLPDNLDPLVDTLSNVVGILVVVVALTQLQVGDALERLIELDASRLPGARGQSTRLEAELDEISTRLSAAEERHDAILRRSDGDVSDAIEAARRALASLSNLPRKASQKTGVALEELEREVERKTRDLRAAQESLESREGYADEIRHVPEELVARLPDPGIVTGEEAWILCRYGRCYLADRTVLIQAGSDAIGNIFGEPHQIRPDEIDSAAHHLRKRDIGHGNFRWRLITEPRAMARLEWRSREPGIERTRLASSPELRRWLAERSPDRDFIRFQVWNDSFEVYLVARQVVESAGFRAGWAAFDENKELDLHLSFGRPPPKERPVEVD